MNTNDRCTFTLGKSRDTNYLDDSFYKGYVSEGILDYHQFWSELDGKEVMVMAIQSVRTINGCIDVAKVYPINLNSDCWFTALVDELSKVGAANLCKCDMNLLIARGCQCGGN